MDMHTLMAAIMAVAMMAVTVLLFAVQTGMAL
jgi:hypothetical protein